MKHRVIKVENVWNTFREKDTLEQVRDPREHFSFDPYQVVAPRTKQIAYTADIPARDLSEAIPTACIQTFDVIITKQWANNDIPTGITKQLQVLERPYPTAAAKAPVTTQKEDSHHIPRC
jgi:hypothetical protein